MTLTTIHDRLSVSIILFFSIMAVWGLLRASRRQGVDGNVWGALVIGEVLIIIQGVLGIILWLTALRPERGWMHILYALVTILALPATYAFTRGRDNRREMLVFGLVFLAVVGLAGRAISTGK